MIYYSMQDIAQGMYPANRLHRSLMISLFTWRRANPDDELDDNERMGWWGDSLNDEKIGSRLWLLGREKLTNETVKRAKTYAVEATKWMNKRAVDAVNVQSVRTGVYEMELHIELIVDGRSEQIGFKDLWSHLKDAYYS
jgi:phage gp46-like protein